MMPETQPLRTSAKSNLGDRVLGKVEKNSFTALPVKGGHGGLVPQKLCLSQVRNSVRSLWQWLKGGVANKIRVCAEPAVLYSGLRWSSHWGCQSCRRAQRCCDVCPLRGQPGPSLKAALLLLGCSSLVSASPPFSDLQLFESLLCPEVPHGPAGFQGEPGRSSMIWGPFLIQPWKSLRVTSVLL